MESPRLRTARENDSRDKEQSFSWSQGRRQRSVSLSWRYEQDRAKSPERQSWRDYRTEQRQRERSFTTRQACPMLKKGINCSSDYDLIKTTSCSKCSRGGHHEFECYSNKGYNSRLCSTCEKFNHIADNCKEVKKFPPKSQELNSRADKKLGRPTDSREPNLEASRTSWDSQCGLCKKQSSTSHKTCSFSCWTKQL